MTKSITLIKLGGSLITDKNVQSSYKADVVARLAREMKAAQQAQPDLSLVIGHGSGSFGHFEAKKHNTIAGVHTPEEWYGFTRVAVAASQLSQYVAETLLDAELPVFRVQPSASVVSDEGVIQQMALHNIRTALTMGLIPLVHGDVALDITLGGTITSTETIFAYLARYLPVDRILLIGVESGVYDQTGSIIPHITSHNLEQHEAALGHSAGVDVTGGMYTKVMDMLALANVRDQLSVRIMSGTEPGLLTQTLLNKAEPGTLITG
ncbi:hypothetical protein G4Y79_16160 [Phototrophicus methaneseepsis]|uniref:Isopentenyl phosphate kinase n=1 Tax=Phototrophicus methaneseepsis TaxID=2710758 RepID=A0A7S8E6H3_9CHLR|nr:isopentenyl phosphate kinase [Phototrophicus methaneseepsis]QPC81235.1 hypothetical protein G4Y79_16160 [Phototrophicus methaneseepsis]